MPVSIFDVWFDGGSVMRGMGGDYDAGASFPSGEFSFIRVFRKNSYN
jgi:hypothetical protein